jgi:hypothetical protein
MKVPKRLQEGVPNLRNDVLAILHATGKDVLGDSAPCMVSFKDVVEISKIE